MHRIHEKLRKIENRIYIYQKIVIHPLFFVFPQRVTYSLQISAPVKSFVASLRIYMPNSYKVPRSKR